MIKYNNKFIKILVLLFFTHGCLYFITGDIYDSSNPVKFLKYLLLMIVALFIPYSLRVRDFNQLCILPFVACFVITMGVYTLVDIETFSVLMFVFPLMFFFLKEIIDYNSLIKILKLTMYVALFFAVLELVFFRQLSLRFSSTGFRSISIFVNPNNFGVFISLILSLLLASEEGRSRQKKIIYFGIAAVCIALSGSMTAAIIYVYLLASVFMTAILKVFKTMRINKIYILLTPFILAVVIMASAVNMEGSLRSVDAVGMGNVTARMDYLSNFVNVAADNILYPQFSSVTLYADNAFIYSWIIIGFFGSLLYFVLLLLMIFISVINLNNRRFLLFFCAVALATMTTNVFNIWPVAYLFWGIVGYCVTAPNVQVNKFKKRAI